MEQIRRQCSAGSASLSGRNHTDDATQSSGSQPPEPLNLSPPTGIRELQASDLDQSDTATRRLAMSGSPTRSEVGLAHYSVMGRPSDVTGGQRGTAGSLAPSVSKSALND